MNFTSSTISFNVRHLEVRIKKISKKVRQEIKKVSNKKTTLQVRKMKSFAIYLIPQFS